MTNYDSIVTQLGEFGLYQKVLFVAVSLIALVACVNNLSIVFLAASPNHWCTEPSLDQTNWTQELKWNLSLPYKDGEYSKCQVYDVNYTGWSLNEALDFLETRDVNTLQKVPCQERAGWSYDDSIYKSSIVTDWDLVCENKWLVPVTSSVYMAGLMVGVLLFGIISDMFGRKKGLFVAILLLMVFAIVLGFMPNLIAFIVIRFFIAATNMASITIAFVIVVELVGPEWRVFTGVALQYFWATGYLVLVIFAYIIRDWSKLQLALGIPHLLLVAYFFFLPESPRWLYAKGRHEEADKIMQKMARINKKIIPEKLNVTINANSKAYPWDPLKTPKMRIRSINIFFNWFVNSMVYYGLSLNTSNLGGNDYINFLISGAVEFPAYLLAQFSIKYLGRRWPLCGCMVIGGASLLLTIGIPKEYNIISIVLAMTGKLFISASFAIIYVFSAEIFPTTVRNVGVSCGSFWARVGGVIAPFIGQLADYAKWAPLFFFGILSLLAGVLALFLPETMGKDLPEDLDEGENFGGGHYIPVPFFAISDKSMAKERPNEKSDIPL